jgi:hypothetical protein
MEESVCVFKEPIVLRISLFNERTESIKAKITFSNNGGYQIPLNTPISCIIPFESSKTILLTHSNVPHEGKVENIEFDWEYKSRITRRSKTK